MPVQYDLTMTSYGVYISQLFPFARASSNVADFNTHNKLLTQKLLKQGYTKQLNVTVHEIPPSFFLGLGEINTFFSWHFLKFIFAFNNS